MKKKLSTGQKRLLFCLVIVAIFVLTYQFIYISYEDQASDYAARTEDVKQQIVQRKSNLEQEDEWTLETGQIEDEISGKLLSYPVKLTKEDNLVFIEDMEKKLGISIPSVEVLDTAVFYTTKLPVRNEAGLDMLAEAVGTASVSESSTDGNTDMTEVDSVSIDGTTADSAAVDSAAADSSAADSEAAAPSVENTAGQYMVALVCPIKISMQITEKELLKLTGYIRKYPELTTIGDAALNYDGSTGKLICSMTINRYVIVGSGREYEEPDIGDISIGTDSLFGTPTK